MVLGSICGSGVLEWKVHCVLVAPLVRSRDLVAAGVLLSLWSKSIMSRNNASVNPIILIVWGRPAS